MQTEDLLRIYKETMKRLDLVDASFILTPAEMRRVLDDIAKKEQEKKPA